MDKSEMFGFSLETDDRTEEEKSRGKAAKKSGQGHVSPKAPMDTDYQEQMEETKPQIRFNLNFDKGIRHVKEDGSKRNSETFDITRLFEAVASGDVAKLSTLHQYLHQNMKKLSNSLYKSYGKTALMKALLHLKDGKNDTVELLIDISEKMGDINEFVNSAFTNSYYEGQTALHIAIERRSLAYVKLLVSKKANVHAKACGKFFQPHDGPNFYFGELPLSLAACTNQPDVVDYLLENDYEKADPSVTDSHGNTVLHALVVVADNTKDNTEFITGMYDRIIKTTARLHPKLKLEEIENGRGLTPLKLAAKTGKIGLFSHILQREFHESHTKHLSRKFTEWVYGPVTSSLYDLASVDSYEDNSVLEILVYGSDIPNRHDMLQTELLNRLLESKWKSFAGRMFFFNFLFYVMYLIIFTVVAYNKREGKPPFPIEHTRTGYLYLAGQLVTALSNCYFFVIGIKDMWRKRPKLRTLLIDGYYEILFFLQGLLFILSTILYMIGCKEYLGFLVLCLALSEHTLLLPGSHTHGVYSIMIQKMILSDILRFLFVYVVFLFGFSAAVVTLLIEPPPKNDTHTGKGRLFGPSGEDCVKPTFRNISYTTLQLFKFTIGMGDMEFTEDYQYQAVFYVLLISYIILTYILLLNMLIALMNRTVERLQRRAPASGSYRVEEVSWNKWNINLGKINEDPGYWDRSEQPASDTNTSRPSRGRSWRGMLTGSRRHWQTHLSTEMNPLNASPV
ncbi:Transient receptor potential cation channel subfamily V member 1 [Collichthys lucidus]|uniref:Transient receptor potential cation channel subfamily V member 1 n=1 Tax=Collichthys lucidus TaxID=240159 RepID=A0A4U5V6N3_COLLU|nr:Transient receptor potential cation channel subfamily V member 1 [Collichthys lucidus]